MNKTLLLLSIVLIAGNVKPVQAKDIASKTEAMIKPLLEYFQQDGDGLVFHRFENERNGWSDAIIFLPQNDMKHQYIYVKKDEIEVFVKTTFKGTTKGWNKNLFHLAEYTKTPVMEKENAYCADVLMQYADCQLVPVFFGCGVPEPISGATYDKTIEKYKEAEISCLIVFLDCIREVATALAAPAARRSDLATLQRALSSIPGTQQDIYAIAIGPNHTYSVVSNKLRNQTLLYQSKEIFIYARARLDSVGSVISEEVFDKFYNNGVQWSINTASDKCQILTLLRSKDGKQLCESAKSIDKAFEINNEYNSTSTIPPMLLLDYRLRQTILGAF